MEVCCIARFSDGKSNMQKKNSIVVVTRSGNEMVVLCATSKNPSSAQIYCWWSQFVGLVKVVWQSFLRGGSTMRIMSISIKIKELVECGIIAHSRLFELKCQPSISETFLRRYRDDIRASSMLSGKPCRGDRGKIRQSNAVIPEASVHHHNSQPLTSSELVVL